MVKNMGNIKGIFNQDDMPKNINPIQMQKLTGELSKSIDPRVLHQIG
jgi:hypothetical protein